MNRRRNFDQLTDEDVMVLRTISEISASTDRNVACKLTSAGPTKLATTLFANKGEKTLSLRDVRVQRVKDLIHDGWIVVDRESHNVGTAHYDVSSEAKQRLAMQSV